MKNNIHNLLQSCLTVMMAPIADFCVSRGIRFQDFLEIAKLSFVRAAQHSLKVTGADATASKLRMMTGIQRPEIIRLKNAEESKESKDAVSRIIGQWMSDSRFLDSKKKPRKLSTEGQSSEFAKLVRAVSKDLNPHTVKFELERLHVIEHSDGIATLVQQAYITSGDALETLRMVSEDAKDLLAIGQENSFMLHSDPHLHARTQYDNIPDEYIPTIRAWFLKLGSRIHAECREYLSQFDRDFRPGLSKGSDKNRVILGTFSRVESLTQSEGKLKETK